MATGGIKKILMQERFKIYGKGEEEEWKNMQQEANTEEERK